MSAAEAFLFYQDPGTHEVFCIDPRPSARNVQGRFTTIDGWMKTADRLTIEHCGFRETYVRRCTPLSIKQARNEDPNFLDIIEELIR